MRQVAIDDNGYYYYLDTGANLSVEFDEFGNAYDANTGTDVQIVYASPDRQLVEDITDDAARVLIAIFGNPGNIPAQQVPIRSTPQGVASMVPVSSPPIRRSDGGGLFGGGQIQISSQTAILIGLGVLLFAFGKSRR